MNPWPFVIAAYAVTALAIAALAGLSWRAMRRVEASGKNPGGRRA